MASPPKKESVLPQQKKFPPPLTFLERTRRTKKVLKEHTTPEGWSVLKEEEVTYYGYHYKAKRSNGRLVLDLVICGEEGDHEGCPSSVVVEDNDDGAGADEAGTSGKKVAQA